MITKNTSNNNYDKPIITNYGPQYNVYLLRAFKFLGMKHYKKKYTTIALENNAK